MSDGTPVTEDAFLGDRLRLRQPAKGHRAGTDAILLAAAAPAEVSGLALDIGAGVGAAGLALTKLRPQITFGLVENDPFAAALARDNLSLNGLAGLGRVYEADVLSSESPFGKAFPLRPDCDSSSGCGQSRHVAGWPGSPRRQSAIRRT